MQPTPPGLPSRTNTAARVLTWSLVALALVWGFPAQPATYSFLEGYTVLDEANAPGVGTNLAATAGLKYGGFGVDVANGIIYLTRDSSTTEDGRTNTTPGLVAAITTTNGFGGAN